MRRFFLGFISSILIVLVPLTGNLALIINYKVLIITAGVFCIWLTQPPVSVKEATENKKSDRFSVLIIITLSFLSTIIPLIDWAYFKEEHSKFSAFTFIGILMIAVGLIFRFWAVNTLGRFFTATVQIKEGHQLITEGPYRIVRHPSYTGAFLAMCATGILLESAVGFTFALIALSFSYYNRISVEEKELKNHFGETYKIYSTKTKSIIPYIL